MQTLLIRKRERGFATFCLAAIIALLTVWAYRPALDAGFYFDDEPNITDSPAIHWDTVSWDNLRLLLDAPWLPTRFVANLSFALNHAASGLEPAGFHLTNLIIHLFVGGALAVLSVLYARVARCASTAARPSASAWPIALLLTGIFLLHPLNTQAVTYIVQRMASLNALFVLLAFLSYLVARYRVTRLSKTWYLVALFFWLLGLGTKENSLLLLPVIAAYELCFFRQRWQGSIATVFRRQWNRTWTITTWAVSIIVMLAATALVFEARSDIGLLYTFAGRDFSGVERLMTQTRVQLFYLSLLVWPSPDRLSLDHHIAVSFGLLDPPGTLLAIFISLSIFSGTFWLAVRNPRYGFPLASYVIFHSLEAGPIGLELVFEHRMYLPTTMLVLLGTVWLVDTVPRRRHFTVTAIILLLFPLANWTHVRNLVWADPVEFHRDAAQKAPDKARVQNNFAHALNQAGHSEEALAVIQRAIALDADNFKPHNVMGNILLALNRPGAALEAFKTAMRLRPASPSPVLGAGRALVADGREDQALYHYLSVGSRFGQGNEPWQAIVVLTAAVNLRPDNADARHALGTAYLMVGKHEEAVEQSRAALDIDPQKAESWFNLGLALEKLGQRKESVAAYERFIDMAPAEFSQQSDRARERIRSLTLDMPD